MHRRSTMKRVRRDQAGRRASGYIVTWDVNAADGAAAGRVRRFVFGDTTRSATRVYRYPGFVGKDGVRYLGQSVLFVVPSRLRELDAFLTATGIDHAVTPAILG